MVKSNKRFEKKSKAKSSTQPAINSATNEILREQKILPITQGIQSTSPTDRVQSLAALSNIVRDETCRKLLLKERIVNILLEQSIKDASQEVVVLAWGALRSLAKEEGYDVALHLYRKDVMVPAWAAIENVCEHSFFLCFSSHGVGHNYKMIRVKLGYTGKQNANIW